MNETVRFNSKKKERTSEEVLIAFERALDQRIDERVHELIQQISPEKIHSTDHLIERMEFYQTDLFARYFSYDDFGTWESLNKYFQILERQYRTFEDQFPFTAWLSWKENIFIQGAISIVRQHIKEYRDIHDGSEFLLQLVKGGGRKNTIFEIQEVRIYEFLDPHGYSIQMENYFLQHGQFYFQDLPVSPTTLYIVKRQEFTKRFKDLKSRFIGLVLKQNSKLTINGRLIFPKWDKVEIFNLLKEFKWQKFLSAFLRFIKTVESNVLPPLSQYPESVGAKINLFKIERWSDHNCSLDALSDDQSFQSQSTTAQETFTVDQFKRQRLEKDEMNKRILLPGSTASDVPHTPITDRNDLNRLLSTAASRTRSLKAKVAQSLKKTLPQAQVQVEPEQPEELYWREEEELSSVIVNHGKTSPIFWPQMSNSKKKRKWTIAEDEALQKGIEEYGVSNWQEILNDRLLFAKLCHRTNVDLKDRYRVLTGARKKSALNMLSPESFTSNHE